MENSTEMFNMLLQSLSVNIVSKAEVRSWLENEPIEIAEQKIKDIEQDGIDEFNIEDDQSNQSDVTTTEVKQQAQETAGKTLNGAQTQSLLSVMEQYASGALNLQQAINILVVSIGVTKDEARKIIEGLE